MITRDAKDISATFLKGMHVLRAFNQGNPTPTLSEIAKITGLNRAVARRLLLTLVELDYVEQKGRTFALTPKVLLLAGSFYQSKQFGTVIQPLLSRYAQELNEDISLAMLDGYEVVFVGQSNTISKRVSFGYTIGRRIPVLHSSLGRMLLAYADEARATDILHHAPIGAYTPRALQDRTDIAAQIQIARETGAAIVDGEFEDGFAGLSVPIGPMGRCVAVIGISCPQSDLDKTSWLKTAVQTLKYCARDLDATQILHSERPV